MSTKQEFVEQAKLGKILTLQCSKCLHYHLGTIYFCQKCGSSDFKRNIINGIGTVSTFTIITIPPSGFEKYVPYAWVVMKLKDVALRVSGFMSDIHSPSDLPVGTSVKIVGFDQRGLIMVKQ